jgi:thymidylate synthase ThyX
MLNDWQKYKPNFKPFSWTKKDLYYLDVFFSNPEGLVTALKNLPPEIIGALCSRASRASGSLLEVFLKEYVYPILNGEDKLLSKELKYFVKFLKSHGFKNILNNQRAQSFYARWLAQYGDDSIAQLTGTHIVFWGISQVAMKFIEDQRIGLEPIEKSTRYVNFDKKINGRYLYYIPFDLKKMRLQNEYKQVLDGLFYTYSSLQKPLLNWLSQKYNEEHFVLEKKAFDTLRALLPLATLGQLALRGNAQSFEYLINRTAKHHLGELRWISKSLEKELDKEIPSLFLRVKEKLASDYQDYLSKRKEIVDKVLKEIRTPSYFEKETNVKVDLVDYDKDAENKIIAGILFENTHESWKTIFEKVRKMPTYKKQKIIDGYFKNRKYRWQKVGRALENSYLRFEIVMDIGAFRDIHRHRMQTLERQLFTVGHGYLLPPEIKESGLEKKFSENFKKAENLFYKIERYDPQLAQYAVPLAYKVRFFEWQNFREFFWETELRTTAQGHPNYRQIEIKKYNLIKDKFPLISKYLLIDTNDYVFARRDTKNLIKKKEKFLKSRLINKKN